MIRNRFFAVFLVIGCSWSIFSAACAPFFKKIEPPRVSVVNLNLVEATLFEQNYLIQLRIQNPNAFEIPIQGLQYEIELNDEPFASGVSSQSIIVPGFESAVLEVQAMSSLLSIFRQINNLKQGKLETISYRLWGKIHLTAYRTVPFDYKGEVVLSSIGTPNTR